MRVMVTGASGNVGTSVLRALSADDRVTSIVGVSRRLPDVGLDGSLVDRKLDWIEADVARDDLRPHLRGIDVVVHLAWMFQPSHRPTVTWRANVVGSARVIEAVEEVGVEALVHASSVGAYSPGPGQFVTESWPTHSMPTAAYGREKAYVERLLDTLEARRPATRVVRMRPGFIFQRASATEQRRLFAGPFVPNRLVEPGRLPFLPVPAGLRFQAVHADDVAEAYRLAVVGDGRGPFNLAADPVVDAHVLAEVFGTRAVEVPRALVRAGIAAAWHLHIAPTEPGLLDLVLELPLLDTTRARDQLGWMPRRSAVDALTDLRDGLAQGAGGASPPLRADSAEGRLREIGGGVGERP